MFLLWINLTIIFLMTKMEKWVGIEIVFRDAEGSGLLLHETNPEWFYDVCALIHILEPLCNLKLKLFCL